MKTTTDTKIDEKNSTKKSANEHLRHHSGYKILRVQRNSNFI